jgi:hypothetical protein
MPNVSKLLAKADKKVDLSKFFNEEAWITIKRIKRDVFKLYSFMVMNGLEMNMAKQYMSDGKNVDINNIDTKKAITTLESINNEDVIKLAENSKQAEKLLLENAVDPDNHNFVGEDEKKIKLNYGFWQTYGAVKVDNESMTDYVIKQITEFQRENSLGELTEKK